MRQRYKDGADFIKIAATGGVLSLAKSGQAPLFTDEELAAVVQTAATTAWMSPRTRTARKACCARSAPA